MTLAARLDVLPDAQRELWPRLGAVPAKFGLYGGWRLFRDSLRASTLERIAFAERTMIASQGPAAVTVSRRGRATNIATQD
jgi:hypothetical protein